MVLPSCLQSHPLSFSSILPYHSLHLGPVAEGLNGFKSRQINPTSFCCKNIDYYQTQCVDEFQELFGSKRREFLIGAIFAAFTSVPTLAFAENGVPEDSRLYTDDLNKFKMIIPQDWQVGMGEGDGVRSLIAFYPEDASSSNVSVVITSLGADFTKLESFGKVDAFAENLVSGIDRSWQRPPGVKAKLVDSKASNGLYYIEYTLQNPGESQRHLFSVLGVANNGWYNRLYTITGQFVDEEAEKYASKVKKAVSSFRLI